MARVAKWVSVGHQHRRRQPPRGPALDTDIKQQAGRPEQQITYHEYAVVDNAGRLQIPREYLDAMGITDRAQIELTDEGILIKPAVGLAGAPSLVARVADIAAQVCAWQSKQATD